MKKSDALYLSAREAAAELAISPATLYAYVSRGLIRSEPSADSRSHRYRAEDIRGLKERRAPSPEPRGLRNFDADLPVMDSAICTITEDGPIYRGVNCVDLAEKDTLEHQNAFRRVNCKVRKCKSDRSTSCVTSINADQPNGNSACRPATIFP